MWFCFILTNPHCKHVAFVDIYGFEHLQQIVGCIFCGQVMVILRDDDSCTQLAYILYVCKCGGGGWGRVFMGN